ncbi:MAG TPA: hypothetical protein VNJ01_15000 [Bacteriovoracaceae bacterium]|nr:hypothetical protein [Bacteriovoracaceae bacterium]
MKALLFVVFATINFLGPNLSYAQILKEFDDPAVIKAKTLFLITHADKKWDIFGASKRGIEKAHSCMKSSTPTVLLTDTNKSEDHFLRIKPDYLITSYAGEFHFKSMAEEVYMSGGFLELCLSFSKLHLLRQYMESSKKVLQLNFITDGIYGADLVMPTNHAPLNDLVMSTSKTQFIQYVTNWLEYQIVESESVAIHQKLKIEVRLENKILFQFGASRLEHSKKLIMNFISSKTICETNAL